MSKERDTHFKDFAEAVANEIVAAYGDRGISLEGTPYDPALVISDIIARRAYDLVGHTIKSIEHIDLDRLSLQEHIETIPDMPELPQAD